MSSYQQMVLFVEGDDDVRFANTILFPQIAHLWSYVQIYDYAQTKPSIVNKYIAAISNKESWDYLFLADIDGFPCVTRRKTQLCNKFRYLEGTRILIVKHVIESWYLAGLDQGSCRDLRIPNHASTNSVTEQVFNQNIPSKFEVRRDYMVELLKMFDVETARAKNESFNYAMRKHFAGF